MRTVVADASVIVKWILPDKDGEDDSEIALALLAAVREGMVQLVEPAHWLAEVAAVVVRLAPEKAERVVGLLQAMELRVRNDSEVYRTACRLAHDLQHHLFDTLYHAVALETEAAVLVTADSRYWRKAKRFGAIEPLAIVDRAWLS